MLNSSLLVSDVWPPWYRSFSSFFISCGRLTGGKPTCEIVDCGRPPVYPGSFYSNLSKTSYSASFRFACVLPFSISGESNGHDDIVRCTKSGIWDFGSLRCDGPTCSDPGRPADGTQNSTSYEESSMVNFNCNRPGYVLTDPSPLMCLRQTDCALIQPVGLSLGWIPDSSIKATSETPGTDSVLSAFRKLWETASFYVSGNWYGTSQFVKFLADFSGINVMFF